MNEIAERVQIQREIVASLMADYDGLIDYLNIPTKDFNKGYAEVIEAMKELGTGDPTLIATKTKVLNSDDLRELAGERVHTNSDDFLIYVETFRDIVAREKIIQTLNNSILNVKGNGSLGEIYLSIQNEFLRAESSEDHNNGINTELNELMEEINGEREVKIIPTGYRDLDALIGGFEPGQIIVVGARPGIGKSMVAINLMANNMKLGEKVALFSLEMPNKQNLRRMLSMSTGLSVGRLKCGQLTDEEKTAAKEGKERILKQAENFELIDNVSTIGEIESKVKYLVHKKGIKIFYIDYLQLVKNPGIDNPVEAITDMSQRLKRLAIQMKVTIIELSQMNRESDKSVVKRASQLRGSGSIEQDADMIFILDKADETSDKIQLSVQKCRDGRLGDIDLIQNGATMQITNLPPKPF